MEQAVVTFTNSDLHDISDHFSALTRYVHLGPITSSKEYDRAVHTMNALIYAGAGDEEHPLAGLLDIIGDAVADYDDIHYQIPKGTPVGALRFLMEQHGLNQRDLPEIGSQGVVSEILSGNRTLNVKQIAKLAKRFGVGPGVFIAA